MTTIIIRRNKSGAITGRCDARCYNANGKKCHCVCGGVNHGKGINEAILISYNLFKDIKNLNKGDSVSVMQGQLQLLEGGNL